MKLRMEKGLLLATCSLLYKNKGTILLNVLIDTGCAVSVFDIDLMEGLGLSPNLESARIVKMYGVGGYSEACIEQQVQNLIIDGHECYQFPIQLGPIQAHYGFDAILGNDFMMASGFTIDFFNMVLLNQETVNQLHYLN